MSDKKNKAVRLVSPKGEAIWPRLNTPDTKYKPEGEFSAKLAMEFAAEETQAFIAKLEKLRDEEFAKFVSENPKKKKAKIAPVYTEETDDDGDETGRVTFNFKMKHKITAKATGRVYVKVPVILNAKRETLKNPPNVGGGSVLKVSFEAVPYFVESDKTFGLTYRMVAVQIINLVEFGGSARAANDFDDEDGDDIQDGEAAPQKDDDEDDAEDGDDQGDGDF